MRKVRQQTFHSRGCQSKAKKAGIAGPASNLCSGQRAGAAIATAVSTRVTENFPNGPLSPTMLTALALVDSLEVKQEVKPGPLILVQHLLVQHPYLTLFMCGARHFTLYRIQNPDKTTV